MHFRCTGLFLCFIPFLAYASFQEPWGKDHDLKSPLVVRETAPLSLGTQLAYLVIHFHQTVISPVDGPRSHYRPSSSQYMKLAMSKYGFFKGYIMGCDRLLRENNEEWVYRHVRCDQGLFKYDPASCDKYDPCNAQQQTW